MALVFADRVKVRSYSTGTAEFILESVAPGFQSFSAVGNGNECYYGIEDHAGNWEVGRGTYSTDSTQQFLYRNTVISSSNSNNLVNFPSGGKSVFTTLPSTVAAGATDLGAVGQNILPAIDSNGTTGYTLGSAAFKWKELFVSNGSIYLDNVKLSNVAGKLVIKKVIRPGENNEEDDPEDSDAATEIKSVNKLVNGNHEFKLESNGTLTLDGDLFTGGGNADTGNFTFDQDTITNGDGLILNTNRGTLAIGTNMETPGVAGHFHIAFDESNINPPPGDLFLGDDYNYVKLPGSALNDDNFGVEISAHDRDGGDSYVWRFNTDGDLFIPGGSTIRDAATGNSLLGGGATSYTPDNTDNWDSPTVNTVAAALDELAAKVAALQNYEIDGGNAYTPALGELLIDGNGA
jgi:hypothetical protein